MSWTDDRVSTLKKLWTEGLSAAQIAHSLGGVTRNAVIGKVHRLGLQGRATPSRPAKRPVRAIQRPRVVSTQITTLRTPRPPTAPALALVPPLAPLARDDGSVTTVLTLTDRVCKWPIGDPQEQNFAFCGRGACQGSYCLDHARLAFQPAPSSKKRRAYGETDELRRMMRLSAM